MPVMVCALSRSAIASDPPIKPKPTTARCRAKKLLK
jgi:hypothetical protein